MEKELDFSYVINIIQEHKQRAYRKINEELVAMHYEIGQHLFENYQLMNIEMVLFQISKSRSKKYIQHLKDLAK